MHSLVLVVGGSIVEQLNPFADYTKVEPYRVFVEGEDLESMAEHFDLSPDDLSALAAKMPEWEEVEAEVYQGRLCYWSRENPNGKFDWYEVGGRFSGYLQLKESRTPSFFGRIFGKKQARRVNKALKGEVVIEAVLEEPPTAILLNGAWVELGWGDDAPSEDQWRQQFSERFKLISDDQQLTVVDIHS